MSPSLPKLIPGGKQWIQLQNFKLSPSLPKLSLLLFFFCRAPVCCFFLFSQLFRRFSLSLSLSSFFWLVSVALVFCFALLFLDCATRISARIHGACGVCGAWRGGAGGSWGVGEGEDRKERGERCVRRQSSIIRHESQQNNEISPMSLRVSPK